jgi:hypothetical protein
MDTSVKLNCAPRYRYFLLGDNLPSKWIREIRLNPSLIAKKSSVHHNRFFQSHPPYCYRILIDVNRIIPKMLSAVNRDSVFQNRGIQNQVRELCNVGARWGSSGGQTGVKPPFPYP